MQNDQSPDYIAIYQDIIRKKYPEKKEKCNNLLQKQKLTAREIILLNTLIFGKEEPSLIKNRTNTGLKPMCATVCPSGALTFDTRENVAKKRPNSTPVNRFIFGKEIVNTKVNIMMPKGSEELKVF